MVGSFGSRLGAIWSRFGAIRRLGSIGLGSILQLDNPFVDLEPFGAAALDRTHSFWLVLELHAQPTTLACLSTHCVLTFAWWWERSLFQWQQEKDLKTWAHIWELPRDEEFLLTHNPSSKLTQDPLVDVDSIGEAWHRDVWHC